MSLRELRLPSPRGAQEITWPLSSESSENSDRGSEFCFTPHVTPCAPHTRSILYFPTGYPLPKTTPPNPEGFNLNVLANRFFKI